jgi:stress-induced morphogen
MPRLLRGESDDTLAAVSAALDEYERAHPGAQADLYRHGRFAVRVRVIDPAFEGLNRVSRQRLVWPYLRRLAADVVNEITVVLLVAPSEASTSYGNAEFEHPAPAAFR